MNFLQCLTFPASSARVLPYFFHPWVRDRVLTDAVMADAVMADAVMADAAIHVHASQSYSLANAQRRSL